MKKVLIVDDDPRLRNLVAATLGSDYALLQAEDGQQALNIVSESRPDLLLLDVSMPKMNGFAVCEKIKLNPNTNQIKVVMITGMDSSEDIQHGREAGADAYFVKPFSPRDLLEKISETLGED